MDKNINVNEKTYLSEIDNEKIEDIVDGWDPSLRGYAIKWDFSKKKWIVIK
jgi:hypothetical protein